MNEQSGMRLLSDDELELVSGGSTKAYLAAVDLMNGKYGTGEACRKSLTDEGLDYWSVQHMANALSQGYGQVAQDVIDGKVPRTAYLVPGALHFLQNLKTHGVKIYFASGTDQADVAEMMAKYDLSVVPVVDDRGYLLGRITHDDATDIIKEEAEEDILSLAGTTDDELGNVSAWRSCWYRLPWLFITLLGGVVTASIMSSFGKVFGLVIVLAAFIPNVMGMGGNTGLQSSVLMIREIASGSGRRHSLGRLFLHELRTGALMGIICGIGIFLSALAILYATPSGREGAAAVAQNAGLGAFAPFAVAATAGLALFCAMTFAAGFGAVVPIVLDRLKIDTAVASGPFISVMDDISALLIYYGVALLLFARLLPAAG